MCAFSRGPGCVQRRIASAIVADLFRRWTVEEAARAAYLGSELKRARIVRASRALSFLIPILDIVQANQGLERVWVGVGPRYFIRPSSNSGRAKEKGLNIQARRI